METVEENRPKQNKGNRRKTGRGYRGQSSGAHSRPWREDMVLLERVGIVNAAWQEGKSAAKTVEIVNRWLERKYPQEPPISISLVYEDRKRALELAKTAVVSHTEKHLAAAEHLREVAYDAFRSTATGSLNRSGYLSIAKGAIELEAKLDGSLQADNKVQVVVSQSGEIVAKALLDTLMDPTLELSAEQIEKARGILARRLGGE